jgi:hypothetical protein
MSEKTGKIASSEMEAKENIFNPESLNFNEETITLLLDIGRDQVDLESLRETAIKNQMAPKNEFHITIIGNKNGEIIKEAIQDLPDDKKSDVAAMIKALAEEMDWHFSLIDEHLHLAKDYTKTNPENPEEKINTHRESYIQLAAVPELEIFYQKLNNLLNLNMEVPPAHVTLYTGGSDIEDSKKGIGINTEAELKMFSVGTINLLDQKN